MIDGVTICATLLTPSNVGPIAKPPPSAFTMLKAMLAASRLGMISKLALPWSCEFGKIRVRVHETGSIRHQYVAQQSVDGTTWTALGVGLGKSRMVTGATGAKVWVRFATVRGQLESDWCTPVLVTLP